jgi:hypothetical protein
MTHTVDARQAPPLAAAGGTMNPQHLALAAAVVLFAALSVWAAVSSEGFLEADACTHYLYARFALNEPHFLVDIWGRPLCTALYALPAAAGGVVGARLTSLAVALALAGVTLLIAREQGHRWPALAAIFVLAQPLVFFHSFAELTELPFALLLACAFLAYQRRQWLIMAVLVGLGPLGRPEGFGFIALAAVGLLLHRRWWWLPVLGLPLALWSYAGWWLWGQEGHWWMWLIVHWPYAGDSLYDAGHLLHFVALLPVLTSPLVFPALLPGVWQSISPALRKGMREAISDHPSRCRVLIALLPLMVLAGHSVLYWQGKMASNGELRYLLVVSAFWALLCARGWEWLFTALQWRRPLAWALVAAVVPVVSHLHYRVLPLDLERDWREAEAVANWYEASPVRRSHPFLMAAHPAVFYFMDLSMTGEGVREWHQRHVSPPPPGTLLVWDAVYGVYNADQDRSISLNEIRAAGWVEDASILSRLNLNADEGGPWRIFRSPDPAVASD